MVLIDALPLLEAALSSLGPGELIKDESMSLLDIMGAVEIMDARTDSYLSTRESRAGTQLIPFDPNATLLPVELLWVLDELLRLEMTAHDGHPLVSTLWRCQYLRPAALAALGNYGMGEEVAGIVLTAMLLGTIKCTEMIWDELWKGQVYEHEDVHLSLASLTFNSLLGACFPPEPPRGDPPVERSVSVDDVLSAIDEARAWVDVNIEDTALRSALSVRLSIRFDLTYALALLTSLPHTSPAQLTGHFTRITSLLTLAPLPPSSFTPSPSLLAIFATGSSAPLPTTQPIREIQAVSIGEAWSSLGQFVKDVQGGLDLWDGWTKGIGWAGIREYHVSMGRTSMKPYPSSIIQTITLSSSLLFAASPPLLLTASFFSTLTTIPPQTWNTLHTLRSTESTWNAPGRKLLGWGERVARELGRVLAMGCQNRPRERRNGVKSGVQLRNLIDEARELTPLFEKTVQGISFDHLPLALEALYLSQILEHTLAGFPLLLVDPEEWSRTWWVAEAVAGRLEGVWEELEGGEYVEAKLRETSGLRKMCRASFFNMALNPSKVPKMVTPFLDFEDPEIMDRARFERRFKALLGTTVIDPYFAEWISWDLYAQEMEGIRSNTWKANAEEAISSYQEAITSFTALGSLPLTSRGLSVHPEYQLKSMAALRRTCFANQNGLESRLRSGKEAEGEIKWDSEWFPVWK